MDKHPDDLLTGDGNPFKGNPNFMASRRGSGGDSGVHAAAALLSISQIGQKTGIRAPRCAAACIP